MRLAVVLHDLVPDATQVHAMLALLPLQHSRRDARQRQDRLVTLADQDRSMWHHDEIRAGLGLAAGLPPQQGYAEELRLQALIAAEHARAPTAAATDWKAIAGHYANREARTGSAIVRLNRAVAVAEVQGPRAGLALIAGLEEGLRDNHRVAAVRAELAQRAGDPELARASYRKAIDLCSNDVERTHLEARLDALQTSGKRTRHDQGVAPAPPPDDENTYMSLRAAAATRLESESGRCPGRVEPSAQGMFRRVGGPERATRRRRRSRQYDR